MKHAFHGDVNFIEIGSIPKEAKRVKKGRKGYVLAEGEVTGHYHAIDDEVEVYELNGSLYLKNDSKTNVTHQEHDTCTIPPGIWKINITKEYDHLEMEIRDVTD